MDAQAGIDELEARNAELEAENAVLRVRVVELTEQVALLVGKIADLEKRLGRNSSNSSKPPSTDPGGAKTDRPVTRIVRSGGRWAVSRASSLVRPERRCRRSLILTRS